MLTHDLDGDPFTCSACALDRDANAHNLYDALPNLHEYGDPSAWRAIIEDRARATVARIDADALLCWCGHALHYPDCACFEPPDVYVPGRLTCAKRYAAELCAPGTSASGALITPRGWECPSEHAEHWPKSCRRSTWEEDAGAVIVECGYCHDINAVFPDGTMEAR